MAMDRREFFVKTALAGAAAAAGATACAGLGDMAKPSTAIRGSLAQAAESTGEAQLNLSSQDGIIPGKELKEKLGNMEKWGFNGIEFGGGGLNRRVKQIQEALADAKLKVSAICAGYGGCLMSEDKSKRKQAFNDIKTILEAAGELKSTGLIVVPAFNGQTKLSHLEGQKILVPQLAKLGNWAAKHGTRIILEPLNKGEAMFLRQLAVAACLCRCLDNPGIAMMGDFYHMNKEEKDDYYAFLDAGIYLHHVHLASASRVMPGQDERSFVNGFRGLKKIGYRDYCSLECGCKGDKMIEIPKAVEFLRRQWDEAKV
jgi:sugar phosphate isomerase/epimerase